MGVVLVDVLEGYTYRTMSTMGEYAPSGYAGYHAYARGEAYTISRSSTMCRWEGVQVGVSYWRPGS